MTNDTKPVNIWRAWDVGKGESVCLVALFDPDTGVYTRRLNAQERRVLGAETVSGRFHDLGNLTASYMNHAYSQAQNLYGWGTAADALLSADERASGYAPTVRGKRIATPAESED